MLALFLDSTGGGPGFPSRRSLATLPAHAARGAEAGIGTLAGAAQLPRHRDTGPGPLKGADGSFSPPFDEPAALSHTLRQYKYISLSLSLYIYIYIERERDFIYIYRERETERL